MNLLTLVYTKRFLVCDRILQRFISFFLFTIRVLVYKKIDITTIVSLRSSVKNFNAIQLGKRTVINPFVVLWPTNLTIGSNVQINPGTAIYGNVSIGDNVMIAPNCMIAGGNHNFQKNDVPIRFQGSNEKGIRIDDDVWIGANTIILDGVVIGKGCVVGAGSVVTKDLKPYSIAVGNPAVAIKMRDENS